MSIDDTRRHYEAVVAAWQMAIIALEERNLEVARAEGRQSRAQSLCGYLHDLQRTAAKQYHAAIAAERGDE